MEDDEDISEINNQKRKDSTPETINNAHSMLPKVPDISDMQSCSIQIKLNTLDYNYLPGTSNFQANTKKCLSKSEHAINHTAYDEDFAKSLLLTSDSYAESLKLPNDNIEHSKRHSNNSILADPTSCKDDMCKIIISCLKLNDTNILITNTVDSAQEKLGPANTQNCIVVNPLVVNNNLTGSRNETVGQQKVASIRNSENEGRATTCNVQRSLISCKKSEQKSGSLNMLLVPAESLSSIGSNVCRICMTKGKERLISPCYCKGSMANVHLSCLERWLNQVGRNQCELCGYIYPAIRTPRYTILQALRLWFGNPRNRNHFQSDCLIFWLLSTVTAGLLAVCVIGTQYLVADTAKSSRVSNDGIPHRFTETAMDFFMAIVLFGYSLTVYLLWKDHYVAWNRWRRANVNVRLLLSPDASPVPFVPRAEYSV